MIYAYIGMSLLFVAIGFIVTENNAKYILAGYNTMSEEERKKIDLALYIPYFRKFHLFLGISFFAMGMTVNYFMGKTAGGVFLGVYPILAYIYFIWNGTKYSKGLSPKTSKMAIFGLAITLIFVLTIIGLGFKNDRLSYTTQQIEIEGSYGELIAASDLKAISLVDNIPGIAYKANGFAMGAIRKGYFNTKEGERVKLIINADNKPYLLIIKNDGSKIYFSPKEQNSELLLDELQQIYAADLFK